MHNVTSKAQVTDNAQMDVRDLLLVNRPSLLRRLRVAMQEPEVDPHSVAIFLLLTGRYPHGAVESSSPPLDVSMLAGSATAADGHGALRRLYRAMYGADELLTLLRARPDHLDEAAQDRFVAEVIDGSLPACVAATYTARVLRGYLEDVLDLHVSASLLRAYLHVCGHESASSLTESEAGSGASAAQQPVTVCFEVPQQLVVSYRTHYGNVAETIWPASYLLCELLMRDEVVSVRGRRGNQHSWLVFWFGAFVVLCCIVTPAHSPVLELGSGVGLVGIVCALAGAAAVCMTDNSRDGLDLIAANVQRNAHVLPSSVSCAATHLDWTDTAAAPLRDPVDVLLMADCWYPQVECVRHEQAALVRNVLHMNKGRSAEAFCAVALRSPVTVQLFEDAYRGAGLLVEPLPDSSTQPLAQRRFPFTSPHAMALFRIRVVT